MVPGAALERWEVSFKAQLDLNLNSAPIDGSPRSRYSQGQIKDLVAYAIPRFPEVARRSSSLLRRILGLFFTAVAAPPAVYLAALSAFTANEDYTTLPGGSNPGSSRLLSCVQRRIGGYRLF